MHGIEKQVQEHEHRYSYDIRLHLIERQPQDVRSGTSSNLWSTVYSVFLSLKWAMLRALEKLFRNQALKGPSQNGVAAREMVIFSHCDYYTFRELAEVFSKDLQ